MSSQRAHRVSIVILRLSQASCNFTLCTFVISLALMFSSACSNSLTVISNGSPRDSVSEKRPPYLGGAPFYPGGYEGSTDVEDGSRLRTNRPSGSCSDPSRPSRPCGRPADAMGSTRDHHVSLTGML